MRDWLTTQIYTVVSQTGHLITNPQDI